MLGWLRRFFLGSNFLGKRFLTSVLLLFVVPVFAFALIQAEARFVIEFFKQGESLLEMLGGSSDLRFEIFGEIDHGSFPLARLPEIEGAMLCIFVGSASALWAAALACHLNERSVDEVLGIGEKKMETTAELSFTRGKGGGAGHINLTLRY